MPKYNPDERLCDVREPKKAKIFGNKREFNKHLRNERLAFSSRVQQLANKFNGVA